MPLDQAVTLANQLLMTAAEYDTATGGVDPGRGDFATVKLLSAAGVRSIPIEEQTKYWEANSVSRAPSPALAGIHELPS
jgi:hypothetical protein